MIWWSTLALASPNGHVELLVGGRTAPESAIQVPGDDYEYEDAEADDEDDEFEPAALAALRARLAVRSRRGVWAALDGSAWLLAPEGEATRLGVVPSLGWSTGDALRLDLAAVYTLDVFPVRPISSSGRLELLGSLTTGGEGPSGLTFFLTGVDRHFFAVPQWNFRALETGIVGRTDTAGHRVRGELGAAGQLNRGTVVEADGLERQLGQQVRGLLGVGLAAGPTDWTLRYRPTVALSGEDDGDALRPQFTALGDYAADADALSGGGFVQHRVDLEGAVIAGSWTLRTGALARLRIGGGPGGLARSAHAHLGLDRSFGGPWVATGTVGVSAAEWNQGSRFVDVYGWAGVRWRFGS